MYKKDKERKKKNPMISEANQRGLNLTWKT